MSNENGFMAPSQQLPFEQGKATTWVPFNPPTPKKKKELSEGRFKKQPQC